MNALLSRNLGPGALVALFALAAAPGQAQTFLLSGHLDDGDDAGAPANGSFTVGLALRDGVTELWSEEQTGVIVIDGFFAIDVGAVSPIDITAPATAVLDIVVDGDALPPMPVSRLVSAARASRATRASTANSADLVGTVTAANAVTRARLAQSGGLTLPFSALTGLPAGVADGDTGREFDLAAGSGLAIANRTLSLGSVPGTKLGLGAVTRALLPATLGSTQIQDGAVTGAKVASGTITGSQVSGITAAQVLSSSIFTVIAPGCVDALGALSATATCQRRLDACPAGQFTDCDGNGCSGGFNVCSNSLVGQVLR